MEPHQFGGEWTKVKLEAVERYLEAYLKVFTSGAASHFKTVYVDAFAGTGAILASEPGPSVTSEDSDAAAFLRGSARVALDLSPGFDQYVFIEKDKAKAEELARLLTEYPHKNITIVNSDANLILREKCSEKDYWKKHRAVLFLDPYGIQVDWATIQAIAATKAIDLWILFPLGQAVMRLLTRNEMPPKYWQDALTRIFGTDEWKNAFYTKEEDFDLFEGTREVTRKTATFKSITDFFQQRLLTEFAGVANNPKPLVNSTGNPIYLLCFAAANERGAPIAKRISQHILKII